MEWLIAVIAIAVGVPAAAWLRRTASSSSRSRRRRRRICRRTPCRTPSRPRTARAFTAGSRKAPPCRRPTVIYFGGNAEEVSHTLADPRWPRQWTIVALNYRGYGTSEGKPGERELAADALAIYDAVVAREGIDAKRIVVFGRSLGTALAAHVAAERPVAGVMLVSPYDSLAAIGRHHYPWLPVSLLLKHRFDAEADARGCNVPMLAIVAERDTIIPVARSRALYDAWAGPKSLAGRAGIRPQLARSHPRLLARRERVSRPAVAKALFQPSSPRTSPCAGS